MCTRCLKYQARWIGSRASAPAPRRATRALMSTLVAATISSKLRAVCIFLARSVCVVASACSSLKRCPLTGLSEKGGYCRASSRYSCAMFSRGTERPEKRAGSSSSPSALITPSAPVASMQARASASVYTPPLAMIGIPSARLTAPIAAQSACRCSRLISRRVRPCNVISDTPACSSRRQSSTVRSMEAVPSGPITSRSLSVSGTFSPRATCATIPTSQSQSRSSKNEPYPPRQAIFCGQPKLRSTASTEASTCLAAAMIVAASQPAN
mmetsp:Transcript_34837/g.86937  ORF Transcript_34837/g.86937 Transcript_34837/m.86937 type:complete len:268 (+) Transcript_34837:394-1197(+)